METNHSQDKSLELVEKARGQIRRMSSFEDISSIRKEIRQRRKHLIGSYISLERIVLSNEGLNEAATEELSKYLAERTVCFWNQQDPDAWHFCYRYYRLAISALASGGVGEESVDDIIQLAECLVRSRETYIIVMKGLLPADMIGELFDFTESYEDAFFSASFEDAVLGAVAVFLGSLSAPVASKE